MSAAETFEPRQGAGGPVRTIGPGRSRARDRGPGGIAWVSDEPHARLLCEDILRSDRVYPIVGLSCKYQRREPPFSPQEVRERIWPTVPIYVIESREARTINRLFPHVAAPYNGSARIWWPRVDDDSEPSWHPLIYDRSGEYGVEALERLAGEFAVKNPESPEDLSPNERAVVGLRSLVRPVAEDGGRSGVLVALATRKDLRRLIGDLRRGGRDYPIVVLSVGDRGQAPAFPAETLRSALEPQIPIYVLGTRDLCRRLEQALSCDLAVDCGDARIYWPGVSAASSGEEHPLVACRGEGDGAVERLVAALDLSRPGVRGRVETANDRLGKALRRAEETQRALRDTRAELDSALRRAQEAEAGRAAAEQQLAALRLAGIDQDELDLIAGLDLDGRLRRLINREWLKALPTPAEREQHPLRYCIAPGFMRSVERLGGTSLQRIAWVAAMVGCGRAREIPGIDPHPLRKTRAPSAEQSVRGDGANAWICKLGGEGASRLHYWTRDDGLSELATVSVHDAIGHGI